METIILETPIEIQRFVEKLNEYNRAPLSAYWDTCFTKGTYLDQLEFPVSRSVLGEIEKRAKNLTEIGKVKQLSKGYKQVWKNFNPIIVRRMKNLGLIEIELHGKRTFVKPLIGTLILRNGEGRYVNTISDIGTAQRFIRDLCSSSRNRQNFNKRLQKSIPDTVEIIFPGWL